MELTEPTEAEKRLSRAIDRAKREGVIVERVFYEAEAELLYLKFRLFGLALAVILVIVGPFAVMGLDIWCAVNHITVRLPTDMVYWLCFALGIPSILAFGYKLQLPKRASIPALDRIRVENGEITLSLEPVMVEDHEDGADGSV